MDVLVTTAALVSMAALTAQTGGAAIRGKQLFHDPGLGNNGVACATCHSTVEDEKGQGDGLLRAGHSLWGVARRPHWRGDTRRTAYPRLGKAIDICVQLFQGGTLETQDRRRLVRYLQSARVKRTQPPLEIQPALEANRAYDRPRYRGGDIDRGRALFFRACNACHPKGRQSLGSSLADQSVGSVALKVREDNGLLRGAREPGAWMPFFGRDRLSDQAVADIAAYVVSMDPQ